MKLEAGKKYRLRSGEVVGPLENRGGGTYPFCWVSLGGHLLTWTPEGNYDLGEIGSTDDIVSEVEKEPSISLELGKWYQMRNGRIVNDLQLCCDPEYPFFSKTHRMTWHNSKSPVLLHRNRWR